MYIYFFFIQSIPPSLPHQIHKRKYKSFRTAIRLSKIASAKKKATLNVSKNSYPS